VSSDFRSSSSRTQISRSADIGLWFDRGTRDALVISDIASSGPITRFGFREGDRIISVNGTRVSSEQQFVQYLVSPRVMNQRVQVIVWRNNQQVPIWVEPWVLVQETTVAQTDPLETYGVVLDDRYSYPVVWRVLPRSPAYYAGIRSGDVIVAWSGQYVYNPDDLVTLAQQQSGEEIAVQVSRNRQLRQLTLDASDSQSSRTALRPDFDQQSFDSQTQTDTRWQQQGTIQGGYGQRSGTQLQGGTYGQTTTGFGQQSGAYYGTQGAGISGQAGAYGQTGYGQTGAYGQAGVGTSGTYGQAGGYAQPGMTRQQTGQGVLNQGGVLPRLRGR
jgi:predicted metalloprotease with PDZ domain